MRNSETGEFELVVGNRQLLSGFFIVVLLFGVAFMLGYVVGQNAPVSAKVSAPPQQPRQALDEPRPSASAPVGPVAAEQTPPAPAPVPEATAPAAEGPSTPPASQPASSVEGIPLQQSLEGPAGSYWQVFASAQPEAEIVARSLKAKGFPTILYPGPNNMVRVMVGPYPDKQALGKAQEALEQANFHKLIRR